MLSVLGLLLFVLAYYRFFYVPCTAAVEQAEMRRDTLQTELAVARSKEAKLKRMQEELDGLGELSEASRMGSYNNSEAELHLLNSVLESAGDYFVSFSTVTRDGDQIRRNFKLQFTATTFEQAKQIITELTKSEYRCLLGDVQYSTASRLRNGQQAERKITVNATATFFETMFDGVADAGLPEG